MSKFDHNFNVPSAVFAECISNSKQIFQLINSILPVESCMSYEVLPLELKGNNLVVGILNLADKNTLDYLHPLAASFGYELNLKLIDSQTHQLILAAYLKNPIPTQTPKRDWNKTIVDSAPNPPFNKEDWNKTIVDSAPNPPLEDRPKKTKSTVDTSMTLTEIPEDFDFALNLVAQTKTNEFDDEQIEQPKIISSEPQISQLINETQKDKEYDHSFDIDEDLSFLNIQAESTIASTDSSPQLTTTSSWQELLERTLNSELDCLELNRQSDFGKIVVSQDGEVQSTIENIRLPIFDALIEEIKLAAKLPLNPLKNSKKVVMERFHRQERVLLRLEFILTKLGETVKIKILRDRALKLYEQEQMDKMSQEVFSLAQKLEKALKKMQVCFSSAKLNNLQDLQAINREIDRQLQLLDR